MENQSLNLKPAVLLLYNINPTWPPEDIDSCKQIAATLHQALEAEGHSVTDLCLEQNNLRQLLKPFSPADFVVFNWCEELPGIAHSYDLIARTLEDKQFTFTGANSNVLAFHQDKRKVKKYLDSVQVPTPKWKMMSPQADKNWTHFPAIVKPSLEHCSYGITREAVVFSPAELAERLVYIWNEFHQSALVEEFIDGREFHVSVIGNDPPQVLPVAEMDYSAFADSRDRLCTFDSKFDPDSEHYRLINSILPAVLTSAEETQLTDTALAAYNATGCRDYARLDIRLRDGIFYVLDVNPNCDISPDTSVALSAAQAGLSYGQLGSLVVSYAAQRHPVYSKVSEEVILLE